MQKVVPCFDWVLIDSPPVLPLVDALLLKHHANATLLVARAGKTPRDAIEKSLAMLGREHVLGVVLNAVDGLNQIYSKYSKYYGSFRKGPSAQVMPAVATARFVRPADESASANPRSRDSIPLF